MATTTRNLPVSTMVISANVKIERAPSEIPNGSYAVVNGVSLDVHMAPDSDVQQLSATVLAAWKKSRGVLCSEGQACGRGGRSRMFETWTTDIESVEFKGGPVAPSAMATDGAYSFAMKNQVTLVEPAESCPCIVQ